MLSPIVVTGGAGFVGSHLCDRLVRDGNAVVCLDNFYTGTRVNVEALLRSDGFTLVDHDVTVPLGITSASQIYNLACPASPIHYQRDPIKTTTTSVLGAINCLELALKSSSPILQASTSEIYGDPVEHPQTEGYWGNVNPIGIRSCYDEGKRCAETLFFDYARQKQVQIKVARIFNTYGPRMHPNDGRVVSNFVVQALKGEPLTIYGDGTQTRSFCYVDDLVDALVLLMNSPPSLTGPINLGNPREFTMLELAELVLKIVGGRSKLVFRPLPADDPRQRRPDIQLAQDNLAWTPKVDLEDGIRETVSYFRASLASPMKAAS
jgi:UDP-glucuronate decarboxylase